MESINVLLQKYLSGKTNSQESQEVEEWIKNNPKEYEYLKQFWQNPTSVPIHEFDEASAMRMIDVKTKKTAKKSQKNIQLLIRRAIAAAAIIAILLSSFLLVQNQKQKELNFLNNHEIVQDLELSDGSQILVNKGSSLIYPKSFSGRFRSVELKYGNAFFEVSKNKKRPFIIRTPYGQVKVLGTSFNVFVGEDRTEVYVKTGKVELTNHNTTSSELLLPEEAGLLLSDTVLMSKDVSKNLLSWKTDHLEFDNAGLEEIMLSLERHFQCRVRYSSDNYPSIQFNGIFEAPELTEILEVIELTCHLKYQIINNEVQLFQVR